MAILESGLKTILKIRGDAANYAELAAYRFNKLLGFKLVPPTVLKEINKQYGILQFFIDHDFRDLQLDQKISLLNTKDRIDREVLLFLLGAFDDSANNTLIQKNQDVVNLAQIDFEDVAVLKKVNYGEFPFMLWGNNNTNSNYYHDKTFPFNDVKKVQLKDYNLFDSLFNKYLNSKQIDLLKFSLPKDCEYCIWQNSLWIKMTFFKKIVFTDNYYKALLDSIERINKKNLENIFYEPIHNKTTRNLFKKIIADILERKQQLINHAKNFIF